MVTKLTDSLIGLEPGLALSIERERNQIIRCVESQLWLTQEGLADDIVLNAGETFSLEGAGKVVVEAVGAPARFTMDPADASVSHLRHRAAQFLHHLGDVVEGHHHAA